MRYGWTTGRIVDVDEHGQVTIEGGAMDGLSTGGDCFAGAKVGEVWRMRVDRCPPFAFGEITVAHRIEEAAAEQEGGRP